MKHIKNFNEGLNWPWKKDEKPSDLTQNLGASKTVLPEGGQLRGVSDVKASPPQKNPLVDYKIDPLFVQEISDRLYGPDWKEYSERIKELNHKFDADGYSKREGKVAPEFLDPQIEEERLKRQQEIIKKFGQD